MIAPSRTLIAAVLVAIAVTVVHQSSVDAQGPPPLNQRLTDLENRVATLQSQVIALQAANAALQGNLNAEAGARTAADTALQTQIDNVAPVPANLLDLANYVSVDAGTISDLAGPHIIFSGANVHIRNASGFTNVKNGLGNFIVGYDETSGTRLRDGSHNIVVGQLHGYSSYGGLVVGNNNIISGASASVSGGSGNTASGLSSSVSGGRNGVASGAQSSVSGGSDNTASELGAAVSGGRDNTANNTVATVSGGRDNVASGAAATVSGGRDNVASADHSHVP